MVDRATRRYLEKAIELYGLKEYVFEEAPGHEGGRNRVFIGRSEGKPDRVLRLSPPGDRKKEDYLAEAEFVRYLAQNGAPVADVIASVSGNLVESFVMDEKELFATLFAYAEGILISDNGYRYREGAPLEEYFHETGRVLGVLHRLAKGYVPVHRRAAFFEKYNVGYLNALIPDDYAELKAAIFKRLDAFHALATDRECFGLVHFDFSDGNYHINYDTGAITVFDFDNCMYCWYLFDLANLWIHGIGWYRSEKDAEKRMASMTRYFETILEGYRSETVISDEQLKQLPLFIDMVLIENIVDEFECCAREGEALDYEDIEDAAGCLIESIPYAGYGRD